MKRGFNLFLDDIRMPAEVGNYMLPVELRSIYRLSKWHIVRNYDEFVLAIKTLGLPECISFDHDLADIHYDPSTWTEGFEYQEKTGYDCAKWLKLYLEEMKEEQPTIYCHSMNPVGKEKILKLFNNGKV